MTPKPIWFLPLLVITLSAFPIVTAKGSNFDERLERQLRLEFADAPLETVLHRIEEVIDLPIRFEPSASTIFIETPITVRIRTEVSAHSALALLPLSYELKQGYILVSPLKNPRELTSHKYDLSDLVAPARKEVPSGDLVPLMQLILTTLNSDRNEESVTASTDGKEVLVIARDDVHEKIDDLLNQLRKLASRVPVMNDRQDLE